MMNKDEYLDLLQLYLKDLSYDEVQDILSDYEEHFQIGISKGKSEEEISKELGSPKDIANNFKGTSEINPSESKTNYSQKENIIYSNDNTRRLLIGLLLIFFNLIIVLGPCIAGVGILFASYLTAFSFIIAGGALLLGFPITILTPIPSLHILTTISLSIGFIGLGILGIILLVYITKLLYGLFVQYFNWNIELLNK